MVDIKVGDKVRVQLRFEPRVFQLTVCELFPQYRNQSTKDWWIEGVTKSGKTFIRFHETEIVG